MTCHSYAKRIREFGCGSDIGDEVNGVLEAGIDGYPFLLSPWWIYNRLSPTTYIIIMGRECKLTSSKGKDVLNAYSLRGLRTNISSG